MAFWGKRFGSTKIPIKLSENKTYEYNRKFRKVVYIWWDLLMACSNVCAIAFAGHTQQTTCQVGHPLFVDRKLEN